MYSVFLSLCEANGIKPGQVARETGIATSTLTNWKQGKYTPKQNKLQLIADYFHVTLEYLMTGANSSERALPEDECKILDLFRKLNATGKSEAIKRIYELTELPRYTYAGKNLSNSKAG